MNFEKALSLIETAQRVLITSHVRPDGDAVGSAAALQEMIVAAARKQDRACECQLLLMSKLGANYRFLLSEPAWVMGQDLTAEDIKVGRLDEFDLIIVVDTCVARQLAELGPYLQKRSQPVLVIDHHLARDKIACCYLIDTNASAAGEIVFGLAQHANWPLSESVASALFVAIATDTGWFRFENASAKSYSIAAGLIEAGARPNRLYQMLFQNFPPERVRLIARTLETLELYCDNRLAIMHITCAMLRQTGGRRGHIENIINECQQIGSLVVWVLLVEQDDGTTRVSLRSRSGIDVNAIAGKFGAGRTGGDAEKSARYLDGSPGRVGFRGSLYLVIRCWPGGVQRAYSNRAVPMRSMVAPSSMAVM